MDIMIWLIIGVLLGAYIFSKPIRTKCNLIVRESINTFRKDNDDDLLDNSKYDVVYEYNYVTKGLNPGKQAQEKPQAAKSAPASKYDCAICGEHVEPVYKMPGYYCCEKCGKIVPLKEQVA